MNDGQKITFRGEGDQEVRQIMWQTVREVVDLQLLYYNLLQGLHPLSVLCAQATSSFIFRHAL